MVGRVFSIQSFCVDDGPGIRTCVYLKGCDMCCRWCHNPESISPKPETSYIEAKCEHCGRCAEVCEAHTLENGRHVFDRAKCDCGGADAEVCPTGALELIGREMAADEVVRQVARDRRYFEKSGGGITVTGGEPMVQRDFLRAILKRSKEEGLHTCIETNGAARYGDYRQVLGLVDLFLIDYKLTDDALHIEMTGKSNRDVLSNIERLCADGANIVLRCPIIPDVNDTPDHFRAIADLTARLPVLGFELMPYHAFGASKCDRLGRPGQPRFRVPDKAEVDRMREAILSLGGREWRRGT